MTVSDDRVCTNAWDAKARALDRYRWSLMRREHSPMGSGLRFIRECIVDSLFGLLAQYRLSRNQHAEACDFLLLHYSPKVMSLGLKTRLVETLRQKGYMVSETAIEEKSCILRGRLLKRPPRRVPLRYFGYAAYCEWLASKYQPHILLNDRTGSFFPPFLRLALSQRAGKLVQLAHATTTKDSRKFAMNDYDYYFLFGQSSLDALLRRSLRFGNTQAVLVGSYLIDDSYKLPAPYPEAKTMLVIGVGPDREKVEGYQHTYRLLADWAEIHPEYRVLFKSHPRSPAIFWLDVATTLSNVEVLPKQCTLAEALRQASIVVNIMSNAVLEAAMSGRPILNVYCGEDPDIFGLEQVLGSRITTLDEFQKAILVVESNFKEVAAKSDRLVGYHLATGFDGLDSCVQALEKIMEGKPEELAPALLKEIDS